MMKRRKIVIIAGLTFLAVVCIVMGCISPLIISNSIIETIREKAYLTEDNRHTLWGKLPGQSETIVFQNFHFYNLENANDVLWKGAMPVLTEKNGYLYQEFDTFEDIEYGDDEVSFFNYKRVVKTERCIWGNNTSPNDKITTLNIGSFAVWSQMKNLPREKLALYTLYQIILAFNNDLALLIYTAGVSPLLGGEEIAQKIVFAPAGISEIQGSLIWKDPFYGMGSPSTLITWILALQENTYNETFSMPSNITGALYTIQEYFSLTSDELESIMSGHLLNCYNLIVLVLFSDADYNCEQYQGTDMCDPEYLGAIQWTSSLITMSPPGLPSIGPSIASLTSAITGYPEMSYYLSATTIGEKYPGVSFSVAQYFSLFNYNRLNGYPLYDPTSLLDLGRMTRFFNMGSAGNFSEISETFNLTDTQQARVLWDYINSIVDYTALQGRVDPNVYDKNNRGVTSELSIGTAGSQSLNSIFASLSTSMPLSLTAIYDYLRLTFELGYTCQDFVKEILIGREDICEVPEVEWRNETTGFKQWVSVYWYGVNSTFADFFRNVTGLDYEETAILFADNVFTRNLSMFDGEIMQHYSCKNAGKRCSGKWLGAMQWGESYVSLNFPSIFSLFSIKNTTSVSEVADLNFGVNYPIEYSDFAMKNDSVVFNSSETLFLLSPLGLLTASIFQQFFIYIFEVNYTQITQEFHVENPDLLANYLRNMLNNYFFNGIFTTKTVNEILWTNEDPIIATQKTLNPLAGGDPSLNPSIVQLGLNQTREQWEYLPASFKSVMRSGKKDIKKVRWYKKFLGADYASILTQVYNGEGPNGPIIEYVNVNPWAEKVKINGGDGWFFFPDIKKSSQLSFYFDPAAFLLTAEYNKTLVINDMECYRFTVPASMLYNATVIPEHAVFYQFGPQGLINQSSVLQMPLFASKPYFLDGDPILNQMVYYTTPQYNIPKNYDSYFDSEFYTGIPMYLVEQLQFNAELKADAMFPLLGSSNLQKFGYNTYMPVMFSQRSGLISEHITEKFFGPLKIALLLQKITLIAGVTIGVLIFASLFLCYLRMKILKKRKIKLELTSQTKHHLLLA